MANETLTGNSAMAITGAIAVAVLVYVTTSSVLWAVVAGLITGYILIGIRIVRPTHRILIEFLGKYQKYGGPGLILDHPRYPETVFGEHH